MAKSKGEYKVVARRYRPQQFDDLIGQEHVAQALRNALASDRVAHAYLFTGARGVGKTSTARILAKALNCEKGPAANSCDKCTSCKAIAAGDDIDVREIDGASNRGIDDVRAIRAEVGTRPARSRYKIYIVDEVHMLTKESFNALLKTLEEPPPHVKFIFATTEVQKVPVTILSRCQRFDFGMINPERIAEQLRAIVKAEKWKADPEALDIIARRVGGSMRDAQSLLEQLLAFGGGALDANIVQQVLGVAGPERVLVLAEAVFQRDPKAALATVTEVADAGVQLTELLDQLIDYWRDLMLVGCAGKEVVGLNTPSRFHDALAKHAAAASLDTILAGLDVLIATKNKIRGGGPVRTLLTMALIRLCRLEDLVGVAQVAQWLAQTPGAAPAASGARPAPADTALASGMTSPPEAKKKAEPGDDASGKMELHAGNLPQVWPEIVGEIGGILGTQLGKCKLPAIFGPNILVISFAPEYNSAYEQCTNPVNTQRIEAALRQRTGQAWTVRLERQPGGVTEATATNGSAPAMGRRARLQETIQRVPLLKRMEEKLGAIPVDIDEEFGITAANVEAPPESAEPEAE